MGRCNIIDLMNTPCETFYNNPVLSSSQQCIMVYRTSCVKNVTLKLFIKTGLIFP